MTLILALGLLFQLTKEDIIKMSKEGVAEEKILAKIEQERPALKLSADDILEMKNAGVTERVLQKLLGLQDRGEGKGLALENRSHRSVRISVDARTRTIRFLSDAGTELSRRSSVELEAPDGTYQVFIGAKRTSYRVTTPAKLTLRGCDIDELEVLTAYVGDGRDAKTFLLVANSKPAKELNYDRPTAPSFAVRARSRGLTLADIIAGFFRGIADFFGGGYYSY